MINSKSYSLNVTRAIILLMIFSYAIRMLVMREGWVPFGDRHEYVRGWPPVLFGLMILLSLGSLVIESFMRRAGLSSSACVAMRGVGFAVVITWGVLRWIGIA